MNLSQKINFTFYSLLILLNLIHCKDAENPYIPTPDIWSRNYLENIPRNYEIETEVREILNTGAKFCETSFQNKKINLVGDNDNIFIEGVDQVNSFVYLSVYKQFIKGKSDIFILKSRCCPMGPCYTSYFFQKQQNGEWKLFDTIAGEVIDYKKTKDNTIVKILDSSLTGLTFMGFWKDEKFQPFLAYHQMNLEIPPTFSREIKKIPEARQISLLKKPKDYHVDNLSFRIQVKADTNVFILNETEKHYFVLVKASKEQISDVVENFKAEREVLVSQIQGIYPILEKAKDLEKLLDKIYYNIGWIEKF